MSIYKSCDIRGPVSELSPELYRKWGRILGRKLDSDAVFIVGGDVRESTPMFLQMLAEGLLEAGAAVVDLGIQPTPIVYFAKRYAQATGCAAVTASHGPPDTNGLKWMIGDLPPTEGDVRALQEAAEVEPDEAPDDAVEGSHIVNHVVSEYEDWLWERWAAAPDPPGRRVVIDPGNGCWSVRARYYLVDLFSNLRLMALHDEVDGAFPSRSPDCARPEHLHKLAEAVVREKAHLGIAFDGDGDRVAFVDETGHVLRAEEATWILLQSFAAELSRREFVYDLKFSDQMAAAASGFGANAVAERSGHTFIRSRMIRDGALFGAEISGHYFYEELGGGDDGLFTACRMLSFLAASGRSLAEWRGDCPAVYMTPDLRVAVEEGGQDAVIEMVAAAFPEQPQSRVDGVRIDFLDGWALVRSSVTAPEITVRFEGRSSEALGRVVDVFSGATGAFGERVRSLYETQSNTEV